MSMVTAPRPRPTDGSFRVGCDIVDIPRFRARLLQHGAPFLARLFAHDEVAAVERQAVDIVAALASCLAIKKAVLAAVRPTVPIPLPAIEVGWGEGDWSRVTVLAAALPGVGPRDIRIADIACSRSGPIATATVIVRSEPRHPDIAPPPPGDSRAIGRP